MAEKLGLRNEGTALRYLEINGVWEDHVRYTITAEDWAEKREQYLKEWVSASSRSADSGEHGPRRTVPSWPTVAEWPIAFLRRTRVGSGPPASGQFSGPRRWRVTVYSSSLDRGYRDQSVVPAIGAVFGVVPQQEQAIRPDFITRFSTAGPVGGGRRRRRYRPGAPIWSSRRRCGLPGSRVGAMLTPATSTRSTCLHARQVDQPNAPQAPNASAPRPSSEPAPTRPEGCPRTAPLAGPPAGWVRRSASGPSGRLGTQAL